MTRLGNGLVAERYNNQVTLHKNGSLLKHVDIGQAVDRRLLTVELVKDFGAKPGKVAEVLQISRQTVCNTLDTYKQYGRNGLLNSAKRGVGNKARLHEQRRKEAREAQPDNQTALPLYEQAPENFNQTHNWERSRYAGGLIYSALLEKQSQFISLFSGAYGQLVNVMIIFAQMLIHGIDSIEQLKAVKSRELGLVCGLERTPSRTTFSTWLRQAAERAKVLHLIKQFFIHQIKAGLVSCYVLYADGHFIPYSGKERVHKGYYTQRRLAMPGQTTIVFHDSTGRIVYFKLEEGGGNLRGAIEEIAVEFRDQFGETISPLIVSDRESWGVDHFKRMSDYRLLTWEKHTDEAEIQALSDELFSDIVTINKHQYRFYEFPEKKTYWNADGDEAVELRRVVIWNLDNDKRPVCVTNDKAEETAFIGQSMLGRWGNSENGFKYMAERFNPHYIPLLQATQESEQQEIDNPKHKELQQQKKKLEKAKQKNANQLANTAESCNKDGTTRANSKRQRLLNHRKSIDVELQNIQEALEETPQRITIAEATDGRETFKVLDREGKNIFDLVQAMLWNARRSLIDILKQHYSDERDLVNLFDHISRGQGWIKSTDDTIYVRLEAMDVPRFRIAQKEFCNSLNHMKPQLPNGKRIRFSVGEAPNAII